jgi:hypothetical protein
LQIYLPQSLQIGNCSGLTNSPTHQQTMVGTSWQPTGLKSSDLMTISRIFDIELEEVSYAQVANNHDAEINQHHH